MNEKFNKNAKVEKLTKKVGRGVRLIIIGPYIGYRKFLASRDDCPESLYHSPSVGVGVLDPARVGDRVRVGMCD